MQAAPSAKAVQGSPVVLQMCLLLPLLHILHPQSCCPIVVALPSGAELQVSSPGMATCLCHLLETVHARHGAVLFEHGADIPSAGVILLAGLFVYDIFWVFCTPVMVSVAKSFDAPIKLLFKRAGDTGPRPFRYYLKADWSLH
jgi:Signal peptide peptidase